MEHTTKQRTVQSIIRDIEKNSISFEHTIQRRADQWNKDQKNELIKTMLMGNMPIPPIHIYSDEKDLKWVIDGKQRLTTIAAFVNGDYRIDNKMEPFMVDGEEIDLRRKKYADLPEKLQQKILDNEITEITYTDCTYSEVAKIFTVLNNGTPLTAAQKIRAQMQEDVLEKVDFIEESELFKVVPFTKAQLRKADDLIVFLQASMLAAGYDFVDFSAKNVLKYAKDCNPFDLEEVIAACNDLAKHYSEKHDKKKDKEAYAGFKKINLPMIFAGMAMSKNKGQYAENLEKFNREYQDNEGYREYCQGSTSKKDNVMGRWNYFLNNLVTD